MFFLEDQSCFIHLKTDQPCSILMRLSLLFNFFKPFFQCFAVLEQQMGQHSLGWQGHKTHKRCEHHRCHPGWASRSVHVTFRVQWDVKIWLKLLVSGFLSKNVQSMLWKGMSWPALQYSFCVLLFPFNFKGFYILLMVNLTHKNKWNTQFF